MAGASGGQRLPLSTLSCVHELRRRTRPSRFQARRDQPRRASTADYPHHAAEKPARPKSGWPRECFGRFAGSYYSAVQVAAIIFTLRTFSDGLRSPGGRRVGGRALSLSALSPIVPLISTVCPTWSLSFVLGLPTSFSVVALMAGAAGVYRARRYPRPCPGPLQIRQAGTLSVPSPALRHPVTVTVFAASLASCIGGALCGGFDGGGSAAARGRRQTRRRRKFLQLLASLDILLG